MAQETTRTAAATCAAALAAAPAIAGLAGSASGSGTDRPTHAMRITELRVDQQGPDADEYVEIAGRAGAPLAGVWFLAVGDSGTDPGGVVEAAIDLSAWALGGNGILVAHEAGFGTTEFGGVRLAVDKAATRAVIGTGDSMNLENSDSVTYLLVRQFVGTVGMDLDAGNDGTLDATPWTELLDAVAFVRSGNSDPTYASTVVGPVALTATGGMPPHAWLAEGGWRIGEYASWSADTPGSASQVPAPGATLTLAAAGLAAARARGSRTHRG